VSILNTVAKYETDASSGEQAEMFLGEQAWKQDVAERVAAHRNRKNRNGAGTQLGPVPVAAYSEERSRAARIAAAVAARYEAAPSYMEMLEGKAESAVEMAELPKPVEEVVIPVISLVAKQPAAKEPVADPMRYKKPSLAAVAAVSSEIQPLRIQLLPGPTETISPELLPVRVIESPRELIAVRRMRPRLAEGAAAPILSGQLRIFEVEADQISTTPEPMPEFVAEQIEQPSYATYAAAQQTNDYEELEPMPAELRPGMRECERAATIVMLTAPLELRAMSMLVDGCVVTTIALMVALAYFTAFTAMSQLPSVKMMVLGGGLMYIALWAAYQIVCFAIGEATIGMRYARIGLCTFDDENPTRGAMCSRVLAQLLSLCPLGLGYLWAWMDMDGLGWHDRMTHMYQRSY
jgi:uncharacterized RDD family membrane protein YckC